MHDPDCIFCRLAAGDLPRSIVFEDESVLGFMDIYPVALGHLLVIPKMHFESLETCPRDVAASLILAVQSLNIAAREALACDGVLNEVMNGAAAGQEVIHLHFHVIPRWEGDGFGWLYPTGYREAQAQRPVLDQIAHSVRTLLRH